MILGFTTGRPSKIGLEKRLATYRELGCKAIELGLINADEKERWKSIKNLTKEDLSSFEHVSLHAPAGSFMYGKNDGTKKVLSDIQELYEKFHFKHAIIHPDRVEDWSVFDGFTFPIVTENMDNRKQTGRTVEGLREFFTQVDIPMVLDVNHCYVNDNSLRLAGEIYSAFEERIVQIHLSGFKGPHEPHEPLHETKQLEIIKAIPDKTLPIIVECFLPTIEGIKAEYNYIKDNL